jgi:CubicO group peptidase (beta-lactamase class C family)
MKKILFIFSSLLLAGCLYAQDSTTKKLEELLTAYAKLNRFNGSVLVAKQGKVLLQKGYGVRNAVNKTFNDADTKFQVASVTKQFTSTVILKLVELKRMGLNDKLSKYYTGFTNGDSITIEQLLTHTSGMHNLTEEDTVIVKTNEQEQVAFIKKLKPDFSPGSSWHYSNSGYIILGYIIQKVSGMSYWEAVRQYIFTPLQMNNSGFDFTNLTGNDKSVGYDVLNDTIQRSVAVTDSTVPFAAGAIYSTVKDMYRWHQGLQRYKIVVKSLMDKAYTSCAKNNYGYGWQLDSLYGHRIISHSGAISGFGSSFARVPEDDICIVLLSNKSGSTGDVMQVTNKLLAILYNQPYSIPVKRTAVIVSEDSLQQYLGTYEIAAMHLIVEMTINKGVLTAFPSRDGNRGPASILFGLSNNHFYDKFDEELEISFIKNENGKINGFTILQMGIKKFAAKIK